MAVTKREVEELLGNVILDDEFQEAFEYAKRKQAHIYKQEQRSVVLQDWYLAILIKEYVQNLAFSRFTMDLCSALMNMEKECSDNVQNTLTSNHIVSQTTA